METQIGPGVRIGRYTIKEKLGQGGEGRVFKAWDNVSEIDVAIKMVPPEVSRSSDDMENIRKNFQIVQKLNHPNIAALKQLERLRNGEYFIVMEFVPGENLSQYRKSFEDGKIPLAEAVGIVAQIASGLDFAHRKRIAHRDIKPENVMRTPSGEIKILDFGLAMQIKSTATRLSNAAKYDFSGTWPYMAPEQYLAKKQDHRTDVYSLGVLFYEMIDRRPPFRNPDLKIMMENVVSRKPDPVPGAGRCANRALARALAKKPENRFRKAGDFAAALQRCLEPKLKIFRILAATALAVFVVAGGSLLVLENEKKQRRAEMQQKLDRLTPELILGSDAENSYERGVAEASLSIVEALNRKGLLEGRKMAITGFREALTEEGCRAMSVSLRKRVTADAYKIEKEIGGNFRAIPRGQFETIEDEIIYSKKGKVVVDLDAVKHLGDPDILIAGTWENDTDDFNLTLTAYEREKMSRPFSCAGGGQAPETFTIVFSDDVNIPKSGDMSAALIDCVENTRKIPPKTVVGKKSSGEEPSPGEKTEEVAKKNNPKTKLYVDFEEKAPRNVEIEIPELGVSYSEGMSVPVGRYTLKADAPGYESAAMTVELKAQPQNRFSIRMQRETIASRKLPDMKFIYIPPGEFMMGSPDGKDGKVEKEKGRYDNEILRRIKLTEGFYMQTTEVTVGQWKEYAKDPEYEPTDAERGKGCYVRVDGDRGYRKGYDWKNPGFDQTDDHPVACVSWNDAKKFIAWLSKEDGGRKYTLPTEAQWEYAARGGAKTQDPFWFGKCLSTDQANYNGNYPMEGCAKGRYREETVPANQFEPNGWGLKNMHGNVWEWCQDWYGAYDQNDVVDPKGPEKGANRVLRGGSWFSNVRNCRSAYRYWLFPSVSDSFNGFRLAAPPGR